MTIQITGSCHCGNLSFVLTTSHTAETLPIRACQCRFCRAHAAATARDPNGTARIAARDPQRITRYRFATKTTDFILCANCGAYVGAVVTQDGRQYATLNMRLSALDVSRAQPVTYDNEASADRVARRVQSFTPVTQTC